MKKIEQIRHSLAHLLASAVKNLYPQAKITLGPPIDNGFYYDIDFGKEKIGIEDLPKIEKEMRKIAKDWSGFKEEKLSFDEAKKLFKGNEYKLELIEEINGKGEEITVYKSGDFIDLCRGDHVKNMKDIDMDGWKLDKIAGAYWRGDEKNTMLTRIYGLAFKNKKGLDDHLELREEMKKRDHRKLGKELDLFTFSEIVGPGLPLFTPKGTMIKELLQKKIEDISRGYGFEKVMTPHLAKIDLYNVSGHAKKFGEELFHVTSDQKHEFVMKPVQCPHQTQIYASKPRSYKDLPIRYMESEKQYRAEQSGEVGGLNRVYAITVEDGHTFCRIDQVKDEVKSLISVIQNFYGNLGLTNYWVSLSVRDPNTPDKYIGDEKDWVACEKVLQEVSDEMKLDAKRIEGEAALYGPKIDFVFIDALGKEIQIPTVQVDFATPKRFKLEYTDENGKKVPPVMVHRAVLGSYERFMALLIEHFAGCFPLWLAPVQIVVIPVRDDLHGDYAKSVVDDLKEAGFRAELWDAEGSFGKIVHKAKEEQKIPYTVIIGDKEKDSEKLTVESKDKTEKIELKKLLEKLEKELV